MAETPASPIGGRQIILVATIATVVVFIFLMVGLRSCSPTSTANQYTVIYSNLDLKDAAAVITRLKELKIPYRIKDKGSGVAVPKDRADDARLGLAEKSLPLGGKVGWEIFDQTKLGATDFDRRIQFIRALSGELSRTINRISAIEDSRVQIVIPETKLFEVSKAPVTASVLLKMREFEKLTSQQINGIVHLVASSVENLRSENVTIIDTGGNILSAGGYAFIPTAVERTSAAETGQKETAPPQEDKLIEEVKAKKSLEDQLTSKVQSLITKMYPPNTIVARVTIDDLATKKTTVIVLIDEGIDVSKSVKDNTFDSISAVIGYDRGRGDRIMMKRAPFRQTAIAPLGEKGTTVKEQAAEKKGIAASLDSKKLIAFAKSVIRKYGVWRVAAATGLLFIFVLFFILPIFGGGKKAPKMEQQARTEEQAANNFGAQQVPPDKLDDMRQRAAQDPEAVAAMLATWVKERAR